MKLLVILEQHFFVDGTRVYVDVQCDREFWTRYLAVFEEVVVCARIIKGTKCYQITSV